MTEPWVRRLGAVARRHAGRPDEAEDLVQLACLAAVEAGRTNFESEETQKWLRGVIRNQARQVARTAVRRRERETGWQQVSDTSVELTDRDAIRLGGLSPSLRVTVLLALNGATRAEIGWLLGLSDTALRQRISQLKRSIETSPDVDLTLDEVLPYGAMRQRMRARLARRGGFLASHDPDGHFFVLTTSQIADRRQQVCERTS
ncbi:RNA polymerase sigma factor [Henriciella algicola]|jgi:DNA-directed RNA polymerase specialized sigma24 family protein|uniref:Sigma-70 family RNA polymerase sigma factor n=1 Tax=Henriciella algicola TaxID=1608422 RepID=A0A399RCR0_9PROT|nr:sigma-70 family RNA polymerase sigma factor [Henriciella algicola]RIJ27582.1 sigma-70 family RNA polymerase sigma factor [Henriciella algicola]